MSKTVAFSGYRPEKLPENIDPIRISLKNAVENCINNGYDTFLCGMAEGFDMMAAQIVIELKKEYNIKLICVIPYDDGRNHNERYNEIVDCADDKVILSDKFSYDSYYVRNEYMVDNCDKLICYYDGRYGGTEYTVDYANKKGIDVFNIWDTITPELRMPKQIDNKRERVVDELKDALRKGSSLSVISAYFTIYAYAELKKELSRIDNMRFLFKEPTFVKKDEELLRQYYLDHKGEADISGNEFEIRLRNELKQGSIAKECAKWITEKVEMKSFKKPNAAQPRMIHIDNLKDAVMINGTVDFTTDGLGITPSNRVDSNMCIYGKEMTAGFLQNFNELWDDDTTVEDVKAQVLEQMKILYKENPPEFIYFITLYNLFYDNINELTEDNIIKTKTGFKETLIWNKLYKFQQDGVIGIIDKMEKWSGCILADSVGLGKTFTALAVIKYYELRNSRVLVLAPKKLRENWTLYTQNDTRNIFTEDRFGYTVLNHTDLSRKDNISKITLTYQLQPNKINISPFKDDVREYPLINFFDIVVEKDFKIKRIAEIVMKSIPYPSVITFVCGDKKQVWTAHQRTNLNDSSKNTLEEFVFTKWLDADDEVFDITTLNMNNFYSLYCGIVDKISIMRAQELTDNVQITGEEARKLTSDIQELDSKIAMLKSKIKKETQFNKRMEMNIEIKKLEQKKKEIVGV